MTTKKSKKFETIRKNWGYFLIAAAVIMVAVYGSKDKLTISDQSMSMASIAASNYQVTTDQITQFYIVAELANDLILLRPTLLQLTTILSRFSKRTTRLSTNLARFLSLPWLISPIFLVA